MKADVVRNHLLINGCIFFFVEKSAYSLQRNAQCISYWIIETFSLVLANFWPISIYFGSFLAHLGPFLVYFKPIILFKFLVILWSITGSISDQLSLFWKVFFLAYNFFSNRRRPKIPDWPCCRFLPTESGREIGLQKCPRFPELRRSWRSSGTLVQRWWLL